MNKKTTEKHLKIEGWGGVLFTTESLSKTILRPVKSLFPPPPAESFFCDLTSFNIFMRAYNHKDVGQSCEFFAISKNHSFREYRYQSAFASL